MNSKTRSLNLATSVAIVTSTIISQFKLIAENLLTLGVFKKLIEFNEKGMSLIFLSS